jgi:hypothetical protein
MCYLSSLVCGRPACKRRMLIYYFKKFVCKQQQQQQQQYITDNRQLPVLLTSQYVDGQKPSSPPRLNPDFARRGRSCQSAWEANRK